MSGSQVSAFPADPQEYPVPGDLPFAEVALSASADALVTGNTDPFRPLEKRGIPVLTPTEFLDSLERLMSRSGELGE